MKPADYTVLCAWCRKEKKVLGRSYRNRVKAGNTDFFCDQKCRARWQTWLRDRVQYGRRKMA